MKGRKVASLWDSRDYGNNPPVDPDKLIAKLEKLYQEMYPKVGSGDTEKYVKEHLDKNPGKVPGGLAKDKKPSDFDPRALAKGIDIEKEHTDDLDIAMEIAMDHLYEDKAYYDKLEKIEKQARQVAERYIRKMILGAIHKERFT